MDVKLHPKRYKRGRLTEEEQTARQSPRGASINKSCTMVNKIGTKKRKLGVCKNLVRISTNKADYYKEGSFYDGRTPQPTTIEFFSSTEQLKG